MLILAVELENIIDVSEVLQVNCQILSNISMSLANSLLSIKHSTLLSLRSPIITTPWHQTEVVRLRLHHHF